MSESSVFQGQCGGFGGPTHNTINYGQWDWAPYDAPTTTVEEIEYDEQGRIVKRTIRTTKSPTPPTYPRWDIYCGQGNGIRPMYEGPQWTYNIC